MWGFTAAEMKRVLVLLQVSYLWRKRNKRKRDGEEYLVIAGRAKSGLVGRAEESSSSALTDVAKRSHADTVFSSLKLSRLFSAHHLHLIPVTVSQESRFNQASVSRVRIAWLWSVRMGKTAKPTCGPNPFQLLHKFQTVQMWATLCDLSG